MPAVELCIPARRIADLVTTEAGSDLIVYDEKTHALHTLDHITATVWRALDNSASLPELVSETGLTEDMARVAVTKLADADLLNAPLVSGIRGNQNRRSLLKKAGVGLVAVPVLISVTAPMASASISRPTRR